MLQFHSKEQDRVHGKRSLCLSRGTEEHFKVETLPGDGLVAGVQLGFHGPHGVITLRVRGQPLGQQGLAQDAVTGGDGLAELLHKVFLGGQQLRVPGGDVQLASRAPVLFGKNASGKVCVERV